MNRSFECKRTNKTINLNEVNAKKGYKNDKLFWKDIANKVQQAYREDYVDNNINDIKYHTSQNISADIDNVLNNINERNPVKLRDYTPKILVNNGIKDLPMYENPSHIRKNILTDVEAKKLGLIIGAKDHYHGLGKDLYIKAIDSLDNPRVIFKRKSGNEYLILTTIKDNNNNNIIVPIEIETKTSVNNITIDINRLKSVYGYDRTNPDLNKYIKDNIKSSEFVKIYEEKKNSSTNITSQSSSFDSSTIPNSNENVNSTTKILPFIII